MNLKFLLVNFVVIAVVGFVVTAMTTYFWGVLFEGGGQADWTLSLVLGVTMGVVLTAVNAYKAGKSG